MPLYDEILTTLAAVVDKHGLTPPAAAASIALDFDPIAELLAESFFASYLLALDHVQSSVAGPPSSVSFQDPVTTGFNVPPKEAIEHFKAKKTVTKKQFNKLNREARSASFTVSRVYKEDVLQGFKDELRVSLETGRTQAETIKRFHQILTGASHKQLGNFHLETVFRTNMQTSYGVGRRRALEDVKDDLPFWTRNAVMDDRTRPQHAALNGITLPADHEFWDTHFCPDGFNCRCMITAAGSIPDDYDPRNPSGVTDERGEPLVDLSYDKRGLPAKVEYGTTLYDLAAGDFAGIPRGATMQSAIEAGVERAQRNRAKKK